MFVPPEPLMPPPRYPMLYQVNTRVWLTALGRGLGRPATLDDVPDGALDGLAALGFDWVWLLGVWQTGPAGQAVSRTHSEWRAGFAATLPDLTDADIEGSGFAISDYRVHDTLGGDDALARLRERLAVRGLRLMLDFVPNHMALDHPWVAAHPDWFIGGQDHDLAQAPHNWFRDPASGRVLAHGRDPYFPGWPDTVQLNHANPALREGLLGELLRIAGQCDGLRCDMAMLLLPEVFARTWGSPSAPFWPQVIPAVREHWPDFLFLAEVYWDLEWTLQQQGFDFCYDKRLYDRLRAGDAGPVRDHLRAELAYQGRLARFLENHDEPRAAASFAPDQHQAAALLTFLTPGLKLFHQGQFEGRRVQVSPHLVRAPVEPPDPALAGFYGRLLRVLRQSLLRDGDWRLLDCRPAWEGNPTHRACIAWTWRDGDDELLVVVNYGAQPAQARIDAALDWGRAPHWLFDDLLNDAVFDWPAAELTANGLFVDLPGWGGHVFSVQAAGEKDQGLGSL